MLARVVLARATHLCGELGFVGFARGHATQRSVARSVELPNVDDWGLGLAQVRFDGVHARGGEGKVVGDALAHERKDLLLLVVVEHGAHSGLLAVFGGGLGLGLGTMRYCRAH